jgi:hypothetical protein
MLVLEKPVFVPKKKKKKNQYKIEQTYYCLVEKEHLQVTSKG